MKREPWEGGYIHRQKDGSDLYIIERQVGGRRYHISTRAHARRQAIKQLEQFEADPAGYAEAMREAPEAAAGVYLTADSILEFRAWLLERERPTTHRHANDMAHKLADWAEDLGARDLRRLELRELKAILARANRRPSSRHRVIAIKVYFSWLRAVKFLVDRREDATLDLTVPQADPEKHRRRKAVEEERVQAALSCLAPAYRDCLLVMTQTGWHLSELERFIREEDVQIAPGRDDVLAVLQVRHKIGHITRTPICDAEAVEAARRIRARGCPPYRLNSTLKRACVAAGVEPFTFGVLRHSVATWAIERGTPPDVVAEFLGHKDKSTTLRFYADVGVPTQRVRLPSFR